jgi:hypothetical protein
MARSRPFQDGSGKVSPRMKRSRNPKYFIDGLHGVENCDRRRRETPGFVDHGDGPRFAESFFKSGDKCRRIGG